MIKFVSMFILLLFTHSIMGQTRTVTGKVSGADRQGLPGVTVSVKGTQKKTITDIDGNFRIEAESGQTLLFSFTGYAVQEVVIGNQSQMNILLGDAQNTTSNKRIQKLQWPPPAWSAIYPFENEDFAGAETLSDINKKLKRALKLTGYGSRAYFSVPNGFALVTQLEKINPDRTSKPERERWMEKRIGRKVNSIWDYFKLLISKPGPDQFRVFAFIISTSDFETDSQSTLTEREARAWFKKGAIKLPNYIGKMPYTSNHQLTCLIYEYSRPAAEEADIIKVSPVQGSEQLRITAILQYLLNE